MTDDPIPFPLPPGVDVVRVAQRVVDNQVLHGLTPIEAVLATQRETFALSLAMYRKALEDPRIGFSPAEQRGRKAVELACKVLETAIEELDRRG